MRETGKDYLKGGQYDGDGKVPASLKKNDDRAEQVLGAMTDEYKRANGQMPYASLQGIVANRVSGYFSEKRNDKNFAIGLTQMIDPCALEVIFEVALDRRELLKENETKRKKAQRDRLDEKRKEENAKVEAARKKRIKERALAQERLETELHRSVTSLDAALLSLNTNQKHEVLKEQIRLFKNGIGLTSAAKIKFSVGGAARDLHDDVVKLLNEGLALIPPFSIQRNDDDDEDLEDADILAAADGDDEASGETGDFPGGVVAAVTEFRATLKALDTATMTAAKAGAVAQVAAEKKKKEDKTKKADEAKRRKEAKEAAKREKQQLQEMVRNLSAGDKLQYFWGPNPERSNYSEELGKDDENWYDAEIETPDDSTPSQKSEWHDNLKQIKDAEKAAKSFMRNEDIEDDEEEDEEEDGEDNDSNQQRKKAEALLEKVSKARRFKLRFLDENGHRGDEWDSKVNLLDPKVRFRNVTKKAAPKKKKAPRK
jgi:hypothetical protein